MKTKIHALNTPKNQLKYRQKTKMKQHNLNKKEIQSFRSSRARTNTRHSKLRSLQSYHFHLLVSQALIPNTRTWRMDWSTRICPVSTTSSHVRPRRPQISQVTDLLHRKLSPNCNIIPQNLSRPTRVTYG